VGGGLRKRCAVWELGVDGEIADGRLQMAGCRLQIADSKLQMVEVEEV